ncbi:PAS domain-containing protein [Yoonia sp. BS5-3]|uniref:PAS domain-containing protein n=1 Tax=Yoonia phaeophyticola TaxID=3137369 RepID=A0ABZ2VB83_9RHOB
MAKPLSALRDSPDCVKLLNRAGRISFMGEQGLRTMALDSLSDVVGKAWWDFWAADQRDLIRQRFDAALAGDVQEFRLQGAMGRSDPKTWAVTLSAVPGVDGVPTSVLVVSRDIAQE